MELGGSLTDTLEHQRAPHPMTDPVSDARAESDRGRHRCRPHTDRKWFCYLHQQSEGTRTPAHTNVHVCFKFYYLTSKAHNHTTQTPTRVCCLSQASPRASQTLTSSSMRTQLMRKVLARKSVCHLRKIFSL